jgi:hypothetical protein
VLPEIVENPIIDSFAFEPDVNANVLTFADSVAGSQFAFQMNECLHTMLKPPCPRLPCNQVLLTCNKPSRLKDAVAGVGAEQMRRVVAAGDTAAAEPASKRTRAAESKILRAAPARR